MTMKKIVIGSALVLTLIGGGMLYAQRPAANIDAGKHASLSAAQHAIQAAWDKTEEARKAHHDQLGGHAEKALQLLQEADAELKAAAEYLDKNHK